MRAGEAEAQYPIAERKVWLQSYCLPGLNYASLYVDIGCVAWKTHIRKRQDCARIAGGSNS